MRLTQITIENFKGIRDRVEIPLRPVTLLFGANSAGKSTMLQALLYLRELLERQNADADVLSAGGTAIHLGGFRQLVHQHDLGRVIRVGVTLELDDDGLPEYELPYVPAGSEANRAVAFSFRLQTVSLEIEVAWHAQAGAPRIRCYTVRGDGAFMAKIELGAHGRPILSLAQYHPAFDELIAEENRYSGHHEWAGPLGFMDSAILILDHPAVIPQWHHPLRGELKEGAVNILDDLRMLLDFLRPVVAGSGELVLEQLRKIRYVGPVREFPDRGVSAQRTLADDRWASGLAAWDWLGKDIDDETHRETLARFDACLSGHDRLNLGYSVSVKAVRLLPEESELALLLALLPRASEPEDLVERIKALVEPELLSCPLVRRVIVTDLRNGAEVSPQDVGNGVTQVIPVVAGMFAPGGSILAVEQPELHLHPAIQCRLADVFIRALHEQENRLFILETHSEHLMLRLMRRVRETTEDTLAEPDLALRTDQVVVLYAEAGADGLRLTALPLTEDGDFSRNWPGGFFEDRAAEIF